MDAWNVEVHFARAALGILTQDRSEEEEWFTPMRVCRWYLPGFELLHFLANGFALLTELTNLRLILIDLLLFGTEFPDEIVLVGQG